MLNKLDWKWVKLTKRPMTKYKILLQKAWRNMVHHPIRMLLWKLNNKHLLCWVNLIIADCFVDFLEVRFGLFVHYQEAAGLGGEATYVNKSILNQSIRETHQRRSLKLIRHRKVEQRGRKWLLSTITGTLRCRLCVIKCVCVCFLSC